MRVKTLIFCAALLALPPAAQAQTLMPEEIQEIALQKVPGNVMGTGEAVHNGVVVTEYQIEQQNGQIMEIAVDTASGKIIELKVVQMAPGESLPNPQITKDKAQKIAAGHINSTVNGLRPVEILESEYTIVNERLAYIVGIKRGVKIFEVVVDANTAAVISSREDI